MSGDSQRNEDFDPLEDDFVIEDLAGKNDDLESLFESPAAPKPAQPDAPADSDDVLFTDHTAGIEATEKFQGRQQFAEEGKSDWQGEQLELDANKAPAEEHGIDAAEAAFTEELGSMLANEEDVIDSDKELELVDGPSADGIAEIEQSGPFVLDDGEGTWQEPGAAAAEADAETEAEAEAADIVVEGDETAAPQPVEAEVAEGIWEAVKDPAMAAHAADDAAVEEAGWEALPEANVDDLSEVDEVAATAEQPGPEELAGVEGHDIYGDEAAPVLVGPRGQRRRAAGLLIALAASLTLFGGAAVVVLRPEWVGLHLEADMVQQVRIERPRVQLAANEQPAVPAPVPQVAIVAPTPPPVVPMPDVTPQPQPSEQPNGTPSDPVATVPTPTPTPAAVVPTPPIDATPTSTTPVAQVPDTGDTMQWPVANDTPKEAMPKARKTSLVRVDEGLMLGDVESSPSMPRKAQAVEGVMPGARAFAQLHNGNFFIGSIKLADAERITLRVDDGEVTLAAADIARLTSLGSADYDALQRATSGFVRLTNSNRLVGGILSQIADDHIVLEFRSNRVILPKSAVGSVVAGEEEQGVRLDTTREEDAWVKAMAQRQIGQAVEAPPAANDPNAPNAADAPTAQPNAQPNAQPTPVVPQPAQPPAQPPRRN